MNILLIEDEPNVISLVQRGLEQAGHQVSIAMDGNSGLGMALKHQFDLIILDLMLPGKSGMEVCSEIRKQQIPTPVLMLTALSTTENIVSGLDIGADDYMTKPFKFAELEARVRTLTRRGINTKIPDAENVLRISDLELNLDSKTVKRAGKKLSLTATEFRLLHYLMKNRNKVLNRMEILENVWDIDFNLGTNVVDVYINYLRKKTENGSSSKLIHTVFGMGYILKENNEDPE
ncbi:MAG TPA: response regulator transcription factor [Bacteroidia bacterium]